MNPSDQHQLRGARVVKTLPLVAHVIHHLATGGMENGLVNLINRMPESRYRHAVICMADYSDFRFRIRRQDVEIFALHKRAGHDPVMQWRLMRLLQRLRPAILHSRNLGGLDSLLPGTIAGVKGRIPGEHRRDERDPEGASRRMIWLRRAHSPLVSHYVTVSKDLSRYLTDKVGI